MFHFDVMNKKKLSVVTVTSKGQCETHFFADSMKTTGSISLKILESGCLDDESTKQYMKNSEHVLLIYIHP